MGRIDRGEKAAAALGARFVQLDVFEIGRTPEESARVVVRLATLDADGPTGTFQDENGEVPW